MKKLLLIIAGFTCLLLGAVGVVMPLLPTTPLVLLAAICFSSANERFYEILRRNRIFGPFIENYRTKQGISKLHKFGSIAFLWFGLLTTMLVIRTSKIYLILSIVGICVTIHLLMLKSKSRK